MPESSGSSAGKVRDAYAFIKAHRQQYSVQAMCRILEVAPSGYYEWLHQPISNRAKEDARLLRLIRASFVASTACTAHLACSSICERQERRAASIVWRG